MSENGVTAENVRVGKGFDALVFSYSLFFLIVLVALIPHYYATVACAAMLIPMIAIFYGLRYKKDEGLERNHLSVLIRLFWRMSYLSVFALCVSAYIINSYGDSSALDDLKSSFASGVILSDEQFQHYVRTHRENNADVIEKVNYFSFLPIFLYVFLRLFLGWGALKRGDTLRIKDWL